MKHTTRALLLILTAAVAGCGAVEPASRNVPFDPGPNVQAPQAQSVQIVDYSVRVPRSLRVSEANRYYPGGDIVWRGEPLGDRHQQVADIFKDGIEKLRTDTATGLPVTVEIEVKRFHALTEKARYTVGGVHAITFDLTVRDAATGRVMVPTRTIRADLDAFGGARAIAAERNGITQKYRITNHLAYVLNEELTVPGGYQHASRGVMGLINEL